MTRSLDALVARAREVELRAEPRERAVADAMRWRPPATPRPWLVPAFGLLAAAALALVVIVWRPSARAATPLWVGPRVAIIVDAETSYQIDEVSDARATLSLARGSITARLMPGTEPYRLALRGAAVEATATGTIYTLAIVDGSAVVHVSEGQVEVRAAGDLHVVIAGDSWSASPAIATAESAAIGEAAAVQLRLLSPPPRATTAAIDAAIADAGAPDAAVPDAGLAPAAPDAAVALHAVPPAPARSLPERWRRARQLRAQGAIERAADELRAISAADDPTWSPLALVEEIRLDLDARAAPEQAVMLADQLLARWPTHALVAEVRDLRCRALRQLGRAC